MTSFDPDFIALQKALAGEYSLERELGRGGMGIVYLAREVQLNRRVAIKVLGSMASRDEHRDRFLREARTAASLSHPNIVPIHRVGEAGGFVFFVMSYVHGDTLGERLRTRGPLSPATATRILREVAWALAYAHGRDIVHRDIKPDNILLEAESGRALVTDFGIARHGADVELTDPGRVMGTVHFMSPEQASSEPLDGRSDLYALGVVGFLALSGRLPFDAPSATALLVQRVSKPAPSLATVAPDVPGHLTHAIDRCLQTEPDARYATGEELAEALEGTQLARATLPLPLRVWAEQRDSARGFYAAWSLVFGIGTISELGGARGGDWWITGALALAPLVPIAVFHARKTYRALAAGYSLGDLRLALRTWQQERRESLAFELMDRPPIYLRALRIIALSSAGTLFYWVFLPSGPGSFGGRVFAATLLITAIVSGAATNALGVPFVPPRLRRTLVGSLRSWFWNSPAGAWTARLLTPSKRSHTAELAFRPTEMALGVAVDELYAALPKQYRTHMADLPEVVRRLEAHAAEARARIDELELRHHGPENTEGALTGVRDRARADLAESVSALEAIRLDLLRLHGGAVDLAPLTTVLDAARRLGEELNRLNAAQAEVRGPGLAPRGVGTGEPG